MKGISPLLLAIGAVWGVVWVCTQTLPASPLGTAPTVGIGVVITLLTVWGYPSVIGPRRTGSLSPSSMGDRLGGARSRQLSNQSQNNGTIAQIADLLVAITDGIAVEITDTEVVLGSAGLLTHSVQIDKARPHSALQSELAARGVKPTGRPSSASVKAMEQGSSARDESAGGLVVASPLRVDGHVVGSVSVTCKPGESLSPNRLDDLARLLSLYMEVGDFTQQAQLAADARLDALRAQINPHFLFNTLNTIASKSRTDADEARQLLQRLADFFRYATQQEGQLAEFAHEYFFVRTYLSLEQARFSERLEVHYDIDPQVLPIQVPVLVIQPLVENAVKHGIAPQPNGGTLTLRARVDPLAGAIRITVSDNGIGIAPELLADLTVGDYRSSSGGVGVRNIRERLEQLYGPRCHFEMRSSPGKGTRIELELPL